MTCFSGGFGSPECQGCEHYEECRPSPQVGFCRECGTRLRDRDVHCSFCGQSLFETCFEQAQRDELSDEFWEDFHSRVEGDDDFRWDYDWVPEFEGWLYTPCVACPHRNQCEESFFA